MISKIDLINSKIGTSDEILILKMLQLIAKARSIRRSATIPSNYDCPLDLCKQKCSHQTRSHTRCAQLVSFHIRNFNKSITGLYYVSTLYIFNEEYRNSSCYVLDRCCFLLRSPAGRERHVECFIYLILKCLEETPLSCPAVDNVKSFTTSHTKILRATWPFSMPNFVNIRTVYIFYMTFMLGHWPFECYSRNPQYQTKLELLEESSVPINPICSEICIFLK